MSSRTLYLCLTALALACVIAPALAAPLPAADALLADAVKRPYGWAFTETLVVPAAPSPRAAPPPARVSMRSNGTPAAGVALLVAGRMLGEQAYLDAGIEIARGVAASLDSTGRLPTEVTFGPAASGGRDEPFVVPDRGPTRGAVALLALAGDVAPPKYRALFRTSARRASFWIIKEQAENGTWRSADPPAPTTRPIDIERLVRLDDRDFRDNVLALLLAADDGDAANTPAATTPSPTEPAITTTTTTASPATQPATSQPAAKRDARLAYVDRAIDRLTALRVFPRGVEDSSAWQSFYNVNGTPDFSGRYGLTNRGVDLLATRFAAQALLCDAALRDRPTSLEILEKVARTVPAFAVPDDQAMQNGARIAYFRFPEYTREHGNAIPIFAAPTNRDDVAWQHGDFGWPGVLAAVKSLEADGREAFVAARSKPFTPREQLALTCVGLLDFPLGEQTPPPEKESASPLESAVLKVWRALSPPPRGEG